MATNTEETVFSTGADTLANGTDEIVKEAVKKSKKIDVKPWQKVMIGGTAGIMLGAGTVYAANAIKGQLETGETGEANAEGLHVAKGIDDNQSFGEAFAAAREEVGPGGVFHWRGGLYGTYTESEWNSMSQADRDAFNSQAVGEATGTEADASHYTTTQHDTHQDVAAADTHHEEPQQNHGTSTAHQQTTGTAHQQHQQQTAQHTTGGTTTGGSQQHTDEPTEPEVRILGVEDVTFEDGQTVTVGTMAVDDHEVFLVDVDRNQEFDLLMADANQNGQFDENEVVDISNEHITVAEFQQETDPQGNMMAQREETNDFNNEAEMAPNPDADMPTDDLGSADFVPDANTLV